MFLSVSGSAGLVRRASPGRTCGGWRQRCDHEVGRLVCRGSEQRELGRPSRLLAWPWAQPTRSGQAENLLRRGLTR